jgi:hypothetical protein
MAGTLAEMQWGRHKHQLSFTAITTCTTLTCVMSGGKRLLGAHFPLMQQPLQYDAVLNGMANLMNGDQVIEMYIVRVAEAWEATSMPAVLYDPRFLNTNQANTFRTAFGYTGAVHVRETGGDGAGNLVSVRWLPTGASQVSVDGNPITHFTVVPPIPPPATNLKQKIKALLKKAFPCFG